MKKRSQAVNVCQAGMVFPFLCLLLAMWAFHLASHSRGQFSPSLRPLLAACIVCSVLAETVLLILRDYLVEISARAYTDVTGVQDKKALEKYLRQLRERSDTLDIGIMMFDLNGLKQINDLYGHDKGDLCIQTFASFLTRILSSNSFLARFGGDEFVIIQEHTTPDELAAMDARLQTLVADYGRTAILPISYAVGYDVSYRDHYYLMDDLMKIADQKMYRDKAAKKRQELDAAALSVHADRSIPPITAAALTAKLQTFLDVSSRHRTLLLMMDVGDFHLINDAYGYQTGNAVLNAFYDALQAVDRSMIVYRFHADVFVAFLDITERTLDDALEQVQIQNQQIAQTIMETFPVGTFVIDTGACPLSDPAVLPEDYITHANTARRAAKHGETHLCCYTDEMARQERQRAEVVHSFRHALECGEFQIYFQPKVGGASGQIESAEVLVRWVRPDGTVWMPGMFVPLLEETGDVVDLDLYVYEKAFQWMSRRRADGQRRVPLALNLSPVHFARPQLLMDAVDALIDRYQVDTDEIVFEITESAYIERPDVVNQIIRAFHKKHIRISMDDFGSGYSSLNTLKDILFDQVKLDRKFVADGLTPAGEIVIQELFHLLKRMDKSIVCEGVETEEVSDFLIREGCDELQGFLYYRPICENDFNALLRQTAPAAEELYVKEA